VVAVVLWEKERVRLCNWSSTLTDNRTHYLCLNCCTPSNHRAFCLEWLCLKHGQYQSDQIIRRHIFEDCDLNTWRFDKISWDSANIFKKNYIFILYPRQVSPICQLGRKLYESFKIVIFWVVKGCNPVNMLLPSSWWKQISVKCGQWHEKGRIIISTKNILAGFHFDRSRLQRANFFRDSRNASN
jgi:hypothetical protein